MPDIARGRGKTLLAAKFCSPQVLLIEPDTLFAWAITQALAQRGCDVTHAASCHAARDAIATAVVPFDCVLVDQQLDGVDCVAMIGEIRRLTPTSTAVLMLSDTWTNPVDAMLGAKIVHTPCDLDELVAAVER